MNRLDVAAQQRAVSAGLLKRLYERAADHEQQLFRRWCLQRAAPEDLAAHFAEAPPEAVVELATPQLCHSGAHLAQLVKRADGIAQRAALAACHEEVAVALRDDKALCMQVARNAPVVVQRMLEVGAEAVPAFVLKRPSMLQGVVKEQISRDPSWLPELCTDAELFQSVVEANPGLLSVSLRRKRTMLVDYVKDEGSFDSLCRLAETVPTVFARMIASVRACRADAGGMCPLPPTLPRRRRLSSTSCTTGTRRSWWVVYGKATQLCGTSAATGRQTVPRGHWRQWRRRTRRWVSPHRLPLRF